MERVDLSKLSNVVRNEVVKKTEYNKLVNKVNNIDTSGFLLKTKYAADNLELEKKIPDISNLATKTALSTVENKITDTSNLVRKTDYNTKITEIEKKITDLNHDKYITTPEFNSLATNSFNARIAQANLVTKTDFDNKLSDLNKKIVSNKTRNIAVEKKKKKNSILVIFVERIILMKMVLRIIIYFSQFIDI